MSNGIRLRQGRVGDLGWMVHRQAVVYATEFGYSQVFETYLHEGTAVFLRNFDSERDRIWIAESGNSRSTSGKSILGFVAIQHDPDRRRWARLRWFLVEREARGHGIGHRLARAAIAFARKKRYSGVLLSTVDDLTDARRLYERSGFRLAFHDRRPCAWAPWGHEQRWELPLRVVRRRPPT